MDIRAETSAGELLDIEMQMDTRGDFVNRIIIYGCKMASKGLESGEKYSKMKKSKMPVPFMKA